MSIDYKKVVFSILIYLLATTAYCQQSPADVKKIFDLSFMTNTDHVMMQSFAKKIKTINVDTDTSDDVSKKLGPQVGTMKLAGRSTWTYHPGGDVFGYIQFDEFQKVSAVRVARGFGVLNPNAEEIYIRGEFKTFNDSKKQDVLNQIAASISHPVQCVQGQIYFNTTDKHIYCFNGTEWLQLDNPKN